MKIKIGDTVWFIRNDNTEEKVRIIGQSLGNPVVEFDDGRKQVTYKENLRSI